MIKRYNIGYTVFICCQTILSLLSQIRFQGYWKNVHSFKQDIKKELFYSKIVLKYQSYDANSAGSRLDITEFLNCTTLLIINRPCLVQHQHSKVTRAGSLGSLPPQEVQLNGNTYSETLIS